MVESEVEIILREIRERVLSEQRLAGTTTLATHSQNGGGESDAPPIALVGKETEDNLALINSYLTTTARAWDRLPPLVSKRSGATARLELWLKRKLKSGTRWFTWEQVNFNAAVHHVLRELPAIVSTYESELARLRAEIKARATVQQEAQQTQSEQHQNDLAVLRAELASHRQMLAAQRNQAEEQRIQVAARLAEVVSELRERVMQLQEEQRVYFKQLSLETSEAAVLEDRARRQTGSLLEALQRRIDQLGKVGGAN